MRPMRVSARGQPEARPRGKQSEGMPGIWHSGTLRSGASRASTGQVWSNTYCVSSAYTTAISWHSLAYLPPCTERLGTGAHSPFHRTPPQHQIASHATLLVLLPDARQAPMPSCTDASLIAVCRRIVRGKAVVIRQTIILACGANLEPSCQAGQAASAAERLLIRS